MISMEKSRKMDDRQYSRLPVCAPIGSYNAEYVLGILIVLIF